jgi:D-glycero-D-manno-heptose 1,7-bisphosphate phosphatase
MDFRRNHSSTFPPSPQAGMPQRPYVLLDRDGTLNVERNYLADAGQLVLLPGAAASLQRMASLGCGLVVVTNQSGIARGLIRTSELQAIHARLQDLLAAEGAPLDRIYTCPHREEDKCGCRKPRTGLVELAARECGFDPGQCFMIGDKASDIELGRNVGAVTFLVRTGYGSQWAQDRRLQVDYVVDDLPAAATIIEQLLIERRRTDASKPPE